MERGHFQQKHDMETKHRGAGDIPFCRKKKKCERPALLKWKFSCCWECYENTHHMHGSLYIKYVSQHVSSPTFSLPFLIQRRCRKRPCFTTKISAKPC